MSQPSACRYIRAVALGLQSIYSRYISLPSSAEKATINSQFYELAHFPEFLALWMELIAPEPLKISQIMPIRIESMV